MLCCFVCWDSNSQTILLDEDFEDGSFPSGWTQFTLSNDGGWNYGDSLSLSSQYFRIPSHTHFLATNDNSCQCNKKNDYLITPYLDFSSFNTVFMNFDVYFEGEKNWGFGAEFNSEKATIEISTDSGETWQVVDSLSGLKYFWKSLEINLSEYAGNPAVLFTFKYNDYSYFSGYEAYGCAIDNVLIYEPAPRDIFFKSIDNDTYSLSGSTFVSGTFRNIGADTVKSFDANYRVNDSTIITSGISGINALPFDYASFLHSVPFVANPGIDTVFAWLGNVNGLGIDNNSSNDSLTKIISFVPYFTQRKILVEDFTSANCTGCAQDNVWLNPLLDSNENNVAQIRYHGLNDEMYLFNPLENDDRAAFYDISSFPAIFGDGKTKVKNQHDIDSLAAVPGLFQIQLNATYNDSLIIIETTTTALADFISGNLNVNIVLVENKKYTDPPGVNDETYFPAVMRKMFPDAYGYSIGKPVISQQNQFYYTYPSDTILKPDSMFAIVFIQDKYSKNVYQSARTSLVPDDTTSLPEMNFNNDFIVYPQPASTDLNIYFNKIPSGSEMKIIDMQGKMIYRKMLGDNLCNHTLSIDVSCFYPCLYLLMIDGAECFTKLISVTR
ncbi:MAG: choice-of-anchor J domain-containing protein [Bacteroidota bacterium]